MITAFDQGNNVFTAALPGAQRQHSSNPQCILVELYYTKTTRVSLLKGRGGVEGAKRGGYHGNKLFSLSLFMQTHMHTYAHNPSTLTPGTDKRKTGGVFTFHGPSNPRAGWVPITRSLYSHRPQKADKHSSRAVIAFQPGWANLGDPDSFGLGWIAAASVDASAAASAVIRLLMFTGLSTWEPDVALYPLQSLVKGHGHTSGLDAILDIEIKRLSALGTFVSLRLKDFESGTSKFLLMCPEESFNFDLCLLCL